MGQSGARLTEVSGFSGSEQGDEVGLRSGRRRFRLYEDWRTFSTKVGVPANPQTALTPNQGIPSGQQHTTLEGAPEWCPSTISIQQARLVGS